MRFYFSFPREHVWIILKYKCVLQFSFGYKNIEVTLQIQEITLKDVITE